MKNPFHIMLIPTLGCPSKCRYCWSSEEGSPVMSIDTIRDVVAWLKDFRSDPDDIHLPWRRATPCRGWFL